MKLFASLAILCLAFFQLSTPTRAHADAMSLDTDKQVQFYGMDDSGHVVLHIFNSIRCGNGIYGDCYETVTDNSSKLSDTAPTFDWDYSVATPAGAAPQYLAQSPTTAGPQSLPRDLSQARPYTDTTGQIPPSYFTLRDLPVYLP
jgi:hypothetical protein